MLIVPVMAVAAFVWKASAAGRTELLPAPGDCNAFFSVQNGVPILMHCPEGMHFNAKLDVCDWPEDAGCDEEIFKYKITKDECFVKITTEVLANGKVQKSLAKLGLLPKVGVTADITSLTCVYVLAGPDDEKLRLGDDKRCADLF